MSISSAVLPVFSRRSAKLLMAPAVAGAVMLSGASVVEAHSPLRPSAYTKTHPVLKYGARNSAVTYVQARLGVRPRSGWFGPRTRAAVKRYQRRHGLAPTGVVGSRMWVKLGVRYAKRSSAARRAPVAGGFRAKVLRYAATHAGKRWVRGGNGPRVFDCSGYVRYVYRQAGHTLRNRASYAIRGEVRRISRSQLRPGDLVFVHNGPGGRVGHVGIYAGGNAWWEAANPRRPLGKNRAWSSNVSYGSI